MNLVVFLWFKSVMELWETATYRDQRRHMKIITFLCIFKSHACHCISLCRSIGLSVRDLFVLWFFFTFLIIAAHALLYVTDEVM